MMLEPAFRKKYSKNQLFIMGFLVQIIGFAVIILMAGLRVYSASTWYYLCLPGIMIYAGYGMLNVIMTIFLSDTVDYGEFKFGTREESVIFSMQTFTVKLASGLAVFLAGFVIKWIHLDTEAEVQASSTLMGLLLWMTVPSIILLLIGLFIYKRKYILDEDKMKEITQSLHEKTI